MSSIARSTCLCTYRADSKRWRRTWCSMPATASCSRMGSRPGSIGDVSSFSCAVVLMSVPGHAGGHAGLASNVGQLGVSSVKE